MNNISAFVEKYNEKETVELTFLLDKVELPQNVRLAINNLDNAESGIKRYDNGEQILDISLAHCFTLEDVIKELISLMADKK